MSFVGRGPLLERLEGDLRAVASDGRARLVLVRGRRRVGKSRLLEEFLARVGAPSMFYTATRQPLARELERARQAFVASSLPAAAALGPDVSFASWEGLLGVLGQGAERERPPVVVVDEFPYLVAGTGEAEDIEGVLQTVWDRVLSRQPLLLVLVGSDLAMMEALATHGRPLFERPTRELVVPPFSPAELAVLAGLGPAEAMDAYLVVGGFPVLAAGWAGAAGVEEYLRRELADPYSPLVASAQRVLEAEFPADLRAREVLELVGSGERAFSAMQRAGALTAQGLTRTLATLQQKRVVRRELPYAPGAPSEPRYTVTDPYLRFWLRFIGPRLDELDRGRADLVCDEILSAWSTFRGRAIEPLVREALTRLLPHPDLPGARHVGAFWNRTNSIEVDLVGADRAQRPRTVGFVGSIKWRERAPFDDRDLRALAAQVPQVPGTDAETRLVAVARAGVGSAGVDLALGPAELLAAWEKGGL